mgnify:FL=1
MLWKYIGRYPKFGFIIIVGPTDKKTSANEQNALTDLQSCSTMGFKKYLSSLFHVFLIICDFFYEKKRFSLR